MDLASVTQAVLQMLVIGVGTVFAMIIIGVLVYLATLNSKFTDLVIIRFRDKDGKIQKQIDRGGIFRDIRTRNQVYKLKKTKHKIGADIVERNYTTKGKPIVELFRVDKKTYCSIKETVEDGKVDFVVTDADIDWAVNQFQSYKKTFAESTLMQVLPYIGITLMFLGLVVIGLFLIKAYPGLIKQLGAAADSLAEAARAQAGVI